MLAGHSQLGLIIGALMYLICLTGSLAVFFEEFERWEQPAIPEYQALSVASVSKAIDKFVQDVDPEPLSLYVVLPTADVPRAHISDGQSEFFLAEDGRFLQPPLEGWTHMLKNLHVQLHLPQTIGLVLVSILGVFLVKLILSGVLAHPRIFKDAFRLRFGGSQHQQQADLHNRLSVWGLPFHLMIGITGAFFGLIGVLMMLVAPVYYQNSTEAMLADIYGGDPVVSSQVQKINYPEAFKQLSMIAPEATPIYLVAHNIGKDNQLLEIAATLPGRLIYSEMYRFDSDGQYINHQGLSDGAWGRQVLYSVYRLHFGHFGHFSIKLLYFVLGMALTVIAASGINIWLAKRGGRNYINDLWCACVWGTPLALVVSAIVSLYQLPAISAFVATLLLSAGLCLKLKDTLQSAIWLKLVTAAGLVLLVFVYTGFYLEQLTVLSIAINLSLMLTALLFYLFRGKSEA